MNKNQANNKQKKISLSEIDQILDTLEKKYTTNTITGNTYIKDINFSPTSAINTRIQTMICRRYGPYFTVNDLLSHYKDNNNRICIARIGKKSEEVLIAFIKEFQALNSIESDTPEKLIDEKLELEQDLKTLNELIQQLPSISDTTSELIEKYAKISTVEDKQKLIEMLKVIEAENSSSILLQRSNALVNILQEKRASLIYRFKNCFIHDGGDSFEH